MESSEARDVADIFTAQACRRASYGQKTCQAVRDVGINRQRSRLKCFSIWDEADPCLEMVTLISSWGAFIRDTHKIFVSTLPL
ncbi:hypothetical protein Plhal304r1_c004g0015531 [Plasmopara halstedii]